MKATKSDGRVCSVCKKPGHNARTCPDKQKHDARATRKAQQAESTALVTTTAPTTDGDEISTPVKSRSSAASTTPTEFEEWTKQIVVPSQGHPGQETMLRATLADYENGDLSDVRLLIQESGSRQEPAKRLDMNVIEKLHELLTTVIQRDRGRRSQKQLGTAHANGKAATATA